MQRLSVDRIENDFVICEDEDGNSLKIEKSLFPDDIKEGNIFRIGKDGKVYIDFVEEERKREELFDLQNNLFE